MEYSDSDTQARKMKTIVSSGLICKKKKAYIESQFNTANVSPARTLVFKFQPSRRVSSTHRVILNSHMSVYQSESPLNFASTRMVASDDDNVHYTI